MGLILGLGIPLGYLALAGYMSRPIMQMLMERPVCVTHQEGWYTGRCTYSHDRYGKRETKPLGELVNRPIGFACLAAVMALFWPIFILPLLAISAKPTEGELRRRNLELEKNIKELENKLR